MLALLTLTSCAPAETSPPYPPASTTYSQSNSGWQGHSYRLASQQCLEYTMGRRPSASAGDEHGPPGARPEAWPGGRSACRGRRIAACALIDVPPPSATGAVPPGVQPGSARAGRCQGRSPARGGS